MEEAKRLEGRAADENGPYLSCRKLVGVTDFADDFAFFLTGCAGTLQVGGQAPVDDFPDELLEERSLLGTDGEGGLEAAALVVEVLALGPKVNRIHLQVLSQGLVVVEVGLDVRPYFGRPSGDRGEALDQRLDVHLAGETVGIEHGLKGYHLETLCHAGDLEMVEELANHRMIRPWRVG